MNMLISQIPTLKSTSLIMTLSYYIGIVACIASGFQKSRRSQCLPILHCILNTFFGGVLRDLILGVRPWLLTSSACFDITFSLITLIIYEFISNTRTVLKKILHDNFVISCLDAIGLASFIAIGCDKASNLCYGKEMIIMCGYITATWGGVLANFHNPPWVCLTPKTLWYHFIVLINSIIYCFIPNGAILLISIPVGLLIRENDNIILRLCYIRYIKLLFSQSIVSLYTATIPQIKQIYHTKIYFSMKEFNIPYNKRYLILHRIRQC